MVRRLHRFGSQFVLLKGGHLNDDRSIDLLFDGKVITELASEHIETRNTHGTGCILAAAIAALLPRYAVIEAARRSRPI